MYLSNNQTKIFCLESVPVVNDFNQSSIFPILVQLVKNHGIVNVYKAIDDIEGFENSLNTLLYEDRNFKDYDLLYFICEGSENKILVNGYLYTLEEIAELFEGKLTGKILHFANSKSLNINSETAQYFLDVTGAKAISGYTNTHHINSHLLDYYFIAQHIHFSDVTELVENLFEKHYGLCTNLGFQLFY